MKYERCTKCVMPSTRIGITFDEEGVCSYCRAQEEMNNVNWKSRWEFLQRICDSHRGRKPYDMVIPVSGGKDSHFQVGLFKEKLGMNPLCVMVDNASWTETGRKNFNNLSKRFDVDIITFTPAVKTMTEKSRQGFFESLWPEKYWDSILYEKPLEIAKRFGIQFVAWGEDTMYRNELNGSLLLPERLQKTYETIDVIFLSFFVRWSRRDNVEYAWNNGFMDLNDTGEWNREGFERYQFEQIDTVGYLTNNWFKYIKFGFSSQTELCSDDVRQGVLTREQALDLIKEYDWKLDPRMREDFCRCLEISESEFWETVDKFANTDLLEKRNGNWRLKEYLY